MRYEFAAGDLQRTKDGDLVEYGEYAALHARHENLHRTCDGLWAENAALRARLDAARGAWWQQARPLLGCTCVAGAKARMTMDAALSGEEALKNEHNGPHETTRIVSAALGERLVRELASVAKERGGIEVTIYDDLSVGICAVGGAQTRGARVNALVDALEAALVAALSGEGVRDG